MDFIDRIKSLSQQVSHLSSQIQNEQATKTAFIMPFIQILGYDVFNPMEVHPEYTADLPGLKGEKVDYAICKDDKPIILIECKWCGDNLENPKHNSQLHRYFHATEAKVGILTNGIVYRFYTDIEKDNIMDKKPFFEFNLLHIEEVAVNELKRFSKSNFNSDELEDAAKNLLYTKGIKRLMAEQLINPSPEFVKFFASQVYSGKMMASVVEKFTEITKRSLKEFINERITERLVSAINTPDNDGEPPEPAPLEPDNGIVTTEEEMEAFYIVKSILRGVIDTTRIQHKDTKSYFGINLDGKVTKTICRIRLSDTKKYIGILDGEGKEAKTNLSSLDEIYGVAAILKDRAKYLTEENYVGNSEEISEWC
jgi:hypothetical protein